MQSASLAFIFKLMTPYRAYLVGLILVEIAWAFDLSIRPYLIKVILDRLEQNATNNELLGFMVVPTFFFIFFSLVRIFIFRGSDYIYSSAQKLQPNASCLIG